MEQRSEGNNNSRIFHDNLKFILTQGTQSVNRLRLYTDHQVKFPILISFFHYELSWESPVTGNPVKPRAMSQSQWLAG